MVSIVDVWWADLRSADLRRADQLPPPERARLAELTTPADQGRRLVGALLLQSALRAARGLPSEATVDIDRTCDACGAQHGRPVAADGAGPHLSVSHSGLLIAVAACATAPVGIDVQRIGDAPDVAAWVAREARIKAGLAAGAGTELALTPPLPGYAAALAVGAAADVTVRLHLT